MSLNSTNLVLQMAPLPPTFVGTPQLLAAEIIRRTRIVSPSGTNFIFIGDDEPTSNVGPWLRGGTKWYVWDDEISRYVPLDISDSETKWFQVGASTPDSFDPPVWLRTTRDQTEDDPSIGNPIGWYIWNGSNWISFTGIVSSGATANRPTSPVELQKFYDTDITCLIWYERGIWRTVSGVPGDVKHVAFLTLSEALQFNPGWRVLGEVNQSIRGRYISAATKDSGASPETDLTVDSGITKRAAFETYGESNNGVKLDGASTVPYPPTIALWTLVKN